MQVWANESDVWVKDGYGFIVETTHTIQGWTRWSLRSHPAITNMGYRPILDGWAGTTNDVLVNAHGVGFVTKVAKNGRVQIKQEEDPEKVEEALEELGYPDLAK